MARYIEFLGVPGVGKTTTYQFLKSYGENSNWIFYEDLCKYKNSQPGGYKEVVKGQIKKLLQLNNTRKIPHDRNLLNRFIQNNQELMDGFWQNVYKYKHPGPEELRFYQVNYIRSISERIQNVKECGLEKICLVDEGLIHNLNYFISYENEEELRNRVRHFLSKIDMPQALVYFTGDTHTIVNRTIARGNLRPRDKFLSQPELVKSRENSGMEKRVFVQETKVMGIPVLELDARESVELKAKQIETFIKRFN